MGWEQTCLAPLLLLSSAARALAVSPVVDTLSGKVQGSVGEYEGVDKNGSYFSFQGIPYADAPINERRFLQPEPVTPWSGVKDVSGGPPPMCPQLSLFGVATEDLGKVGGSEDCLFLNIYTEELPSLKSFDLKPVLIWIHGGGFTMGTGAGMIDSDGAGEDFLLESGFVVVTLNYRLGPLGFLAIEGSDITGNQGMKDQVLALRWVKENIVNFGGDPGKITISGESAGGISVHAHVLSPVAKDENLFQAAIAQSGTMLMLPDLEKTYSDSLRYFTNLCGNVTISDYSKSCLYDLSIDDLLVESSRANALWTAPVEEQEAMELAGGLATYQFWPTIDDHSPEPFMPAHPITILHNQQQKMVPFMSGITKDEGALFGARYWKDMKPSDNKVQENFAYLGAKTLLLKDAKDITFDMKLEAKMIGRFYTGKDGITRENIQDVMDIYTDAYFAAPNTETIKLHTQATAPVYNYLYTYKGSGSFSPFYAFGDPEAAQADFGVAHGDDLFSMFRISAMTNYTETDKQFIRIYQRLILSFAKYGNPTPLVTEQIPMWPPAQKSKAACVFMDLNLEPVEKHRMFAERMTFWNLIKFKELLQKYEIDEEEKDLLEEIDTTITEEEDKEEGKATTARVLRRKAWKKNKKGKGKWKGKKKAALKHRRLAKRLRKLQCP